MRFPAAFTHPFGLALLVVSTLIALVIAVATDSVNRALWVLLWGLVAFTATVCVAVLMQPRRDGGVTRLSTPDSGADDYVRLVEEALRHLNDHGALAASQLVRAIPRTLQAARDGSTPQGRREGTPLEQAQTLHEVLLRAIQRLRPAGEGETGSREALEYTVLYEEYVLRRPNKSIMTRLSIGERTFFRYRHAGIEAIGRELQTQEQLLAGDKPLARGER